MNKKIKTITLRIKAGLATLFLLGVAHSCVPTINVRQQNSAVPDTFDIKTSDSTTTATVKWKEFFSDPSLIALIDSALTNNQELNIMLQQVDMAQNEIKAKKGEYLPFVNGYVGAEVEKVGRFTRNGAVEAGLEIREGEEFPEPLSGFSIGVAATWELDVWKKLRNAKKSAIFEYLASVEGKNFMVTNLVAEIANSYYELVALDNQLANIEQNLQIQQNALNMVKLQKQAARATELAVRRFEAEVLKNQSHKYELKQQIVEAENKINFLIGRPPGAIQRYRENFIAMETDTLYAGLPSQLLQNRPDIKQAEWELEAAKLNTKVARANFYPALGIRADFGLEAFNPKFLTATPESLLYSLVGDVAGPLINRNGIKAAYKNANARQLQAIYEFEKAILNGVIEVSNQLANIDNLKMNFKLKTGQVVALTESIDISLRLFQSARADYMEVLLVQREALDTKLELIETKKNLMAARVKMYRALGGGWN